MKTRIGAILLIMIAGLIFAGKSSLQTGPREVPETIVLAEKAMLGKVTFKHKEHYERKIGDKEVTCVSCHHVEQPAADAAKVEGHKTVYPADRTATLTLESYKDPKTPTVSDCRTCHVAKGATPTLVKDIPSVTVGDKTTVLNNQQAFHMSCSDCHEAQLKANPASKAPKASQCMACHKKG